MEDRRSVKSKRAIEDAFLTLLTKKKINKITVAEITKLADIGRGTFYLHYQDVYDLYDKIETELYSGLTEIFDGAFPTANPANCTRLIETITEYIENNSEIFLLLMSSETNTSVLKKLNVIFYEKVLWEDTPFTPTNFDKTESTFIVSGVIGVLESWLVGGLAIPKTEISDALNKLLMKF